MSHFIRTFLAIGLTAILALPTAFAGDSKDKSATKGRSSKGAADRSQKTDGSEIADVSLIDAARDGQISITAKAEAMVA